MFYDKDAGPSLIRDRNVTIISYGLQGHVHTLSLNDSGVKAATGLRKNGTSWNKVINAGLQVREVAETVKETDTVMTLLPDEQIADVYRNEAHNSIKQGTALAFAHGFNMYYGTVIPRTDLDVIVTVPKAPGHTMRGTYTQGDGVPHLIAVHQDKPGAACDVALSYTTANGGGRAGIVETNFREEVETGLLGKQAVLCGGTVELTKADFEMLVETGHAPEMACSECLHELKLVVDLIYEGGVASMNYSISNNAEYGEYATSPRVVTEEIKKTMKQCLKDIQADGYIKSFLLKYKVGQLTLISCHHLTEEHQIEQVSAKLRTMMLWIAKSKLVNQSRN